MNRKLLRSLRMKKYRKRHGLFLVEGARLVGELLDSPLTVRTLLVQQDRTENPAIAALLARAGGVQIETVGRKLISSLCDTVQPQGVLAVAELPATEERTLLGASRLVVLDRLADPGNLGTLLRSAWALGAEGALLTAGTVEPTGEKALRASMGAVFHLPWATAGPLPQLCGRLRDSGFELLSAVPAGGADPRTLERPDRWALLLGSEAQGLPEGLEARSLTLPMRADAESLNVAIAGALLLYELGRRS